MNGTGSVAVPTACTMSPTMPKPPMPSVTMWSKSAAAGRCRRSILPARSWAPASCSGNAQSASPTLSESTAIGLGSGLEGRCDAVGLGLGPETGVFGVVDRLGVVDQHDRDVVAHRVPPLEPGV